jgi:NADH-quinone oxidoreductase subunit J
LLVAQNVFFWLFAVVIAVSALRVVTANDVMHAALYLIMVLAGVAAQFILLGQEFVAWVQVIVYIGAVAILFLFGIMLTRLPMQRGDPLTHGKATVIGGAIVSVGFLVVLAGLLVDEFGDDKVGLTRPQRTSEVANSIFRTYLIPFEVVGVLLLGALIGAVVLARRD